ncbi:MAG: class I SAM-dependent methyltransferase [Acidimicrobiaceae bacterium]|nr:class I SAM-dependent methyltransferase [Acidimicrobiaceae bacterium]
MTSASASASASATSSSRSEVAQQSLGATAYDQWFDTPWGRYSFDIESSLVLNAVGPLSRDTQVLDVGCGTGRLTALLEASGATVVGLDLDPSMLMIASSRTRGRLILSDALTIPVGDEIFDRVIAVTLCEFTHDPGAVFAELSRVTRPGGRIVVGALNPRSPWGLRWRRRLRRPPWSDTEFISRRELLALASPFGRVSIRAALYAPGTIVGLRIVGPVLERLGALVPTLGAFQVVAIDKSRL